MKLLISVVLCLAALSVSASQKAMTEEGEVVILHDDGTWSYESSHAASDTEIPLNPAIFSKDSRASFELKSTKTNSVFAIDPKKWKFKKNENGHEDAEYTFQLKEGDLYGMVISEQVEIDVEALTDIAFENAKGAAPDAKVVKKEYRMVNGHKVIYMEIVGTIQSIKFKYLGYYFSNSTGSTQYLTYTGTNLEQKYKDDINMFLNGFSTY